MLHLRCLQVFPFEQLARLQNVREDYEPPEPKPFKPRVDPSSWLADEQHRDQFVLRYSEPHPSGKLVRMPNVRFDFVTHVRSFATGAVALLAPSVERRTKTMVPSCPFIMLYGRYANIGTLIPACRVNDGTASPKYNELSLDESLQICVIRITAVSPCVAVVGCCQVHEAQVMWCEKLQAPNLCYGGEREKEAGKSW